MSNPLYYKIKETVEIDKHHLVDLFFRDWVDGVCDNKVNFRIAHPYISGCSETLVVDFESQEDAVAMRLQGIPPKFQMYLEIVN